MRGAARRDGAREEPAGKEGDPIQWQVPSWIKAPATDPGPSQPNGALDADVEGLLRKSPLRTPGGVSHAESVAGDAPLKKQPATATPRPPAGPGSTVRDLFDWRGIAESQKGVGMHGRPGSVLMTPPMNSETWVRQRRSPALTQLLRGARRAALASRTGRNKAPPAPEDSVRLAVEARRYQMRWKAVLAIEAELEEARLRQQRRRPMEELVSLGIALDGLQAYWQKQRHFGRRVGVFKLPGARRLPRHKFSPGNVVDVVPEGAVGDWVPPKDGHRADAERKADDAEAHAGPSAAPGEPRRIPAEVVDASPTQIRLRFSEEHDHVDLVEFDSWRLDEGENTVANERTNAALDALLYDPDACVDTNTATRRNAVKGAPVRDVLLGTAPPPGREHGLFAEDLRIRSWYERHARPAALRVEGDPELGLNASQTRAVATMLKERVSLVQGPPGTGKTRTLVQTVRLLKQHFQVPHPVLLAAHTNVAVDNLAEGCMRAGLRVVRAGSTAAVRNTIGDVTLEARIAQHPDKASLDALEATVKALHEQRTALDADLTQAAADAAEADAAPSAEMRTQIEALRARLQNTVRRLSRVVGARHMLRTRILTEVLHGADVVCTTAIGAGSSQLDVIDFPLVFLDEGSMLTEPVALIPLVRGCEQLAIIGDHKQLPPVLHSTEARRQGLSTSLFERLIRQGTAEAGERGAALPRVPSVMLTEQFRMHPLLARFPNHAFYDGELHDAAPTAELAPLASAFAAHGADGAPLPLTLVTHAPARADDGRVLPGFLADSVSPFSREQADMALELVCDLLARHAHLRGQDIGIVTPYEAQVRLLQRMLGAACGAPDALAAALQSGLLNDDAADMLAALDPERAAELAHIEVHTVDGFEGREKQVMVFSTVKAGGGALAGSPALHAALASPGAQTVARLAKSTPLRGGYVGFLADTRRLNVALTRAKSQLFVLGNLDTLLSARLGEQGEQNVEKSNVHVIREYARWLLEHGLVIDMEKVRERQLDTLLAEPPDEP